MKKTAKNRVRPIQYLKTTAADGNHVNSDADRGGLYGRVGSDPVFSLGQSLFFRSVINIILTAGFVLLAFVIIVPFCAQARFDTAEKLVGKCKWPAAEAAFADAMKIDPFNAEYPARYGLFLLDKAKYADNKEPLYKRSAELYGRAVRLNPQDAESWARLGQAYVGLAIEESPRSTVHSPQKSPQSTVHSPRYIERGFECFMKAVKLDPNGFNVNYLVGYTGILIWDSLDDKEKDFVIARMKHSLKQKPWLGRNVYRMFWDKTKDFEVLRKVTPDDLRSNENLYNFVIANGLWQFRKAQADAVSYYSTKEGAGQFEEDRKREFKIIEGLKKEASSEKKPRSAAVWEKVDGKWRVSSEAEQALSRKEALVSRRQSGIVFPEDWRIGPEDGGAIHRPNGQLYSNSTMYAAVNAPSGPAVVSIRAKGTPAGGVYPYMIVGLDGEDIGETYVDGPEPKEYRFDVDTKGGMAVLSISFVNDFCDPDKKEDRNLFVEDTVIVKDEEKSV